MNKKKILIIDDEENFTKIVKMNLEQTGKYEVMTRNDGKNVLDFVIQFKPDMILLDIIMPGIQGGDIARQIRSDNNLKDIPIAFLTALVTKKEIDSLRGIISGYPSLAKPVTKEELIDFIEEHLKKS